MVIYNGYKKFINILGSCLDIVGIFLMLVMTGIIAAQVFGRYILQATFGWAEEISMLIMVWFVYFGVVIGLKEDLHIGISMFVSRLPKKAIFVVEIFVSLCILVVSIIFLYYGIFLGFLSPISNNLLPASGLPVGYYYFVLGIAGGLMILVILSQIAKQILDIKEQKKES